MGELIMSDKVTYVVASKVKQYAADKGYRFGAEAVDRLSDEVARLLDRAAQRCEESGRKTIKAQDI